MVMYPSQFSFSFRKTVFPGFLPGTLLFENERSAGKPDCDLVSPSDKNYLFRFISRLSRLQRMPRLQASHKRFPRTLTQIRPPSTKRSREIVPPIAPSFSSTTESFAGSHIVYCRFDFTWATLRLLPQTEFAYQLHAGMHYAILYAVLHNYCILKHILHKVFRPTLKEIRVARYFILYN